MKGTRRGRPPPPGSQRAPFPEDAPSLYALDAFSHLDIHRWAKQSARLDELQTISYYGLEAERHKHRPALLSALRNAPSIFLDLGEWHRIVEYTYCLDPLSARGSVRGYGGRCNIGAEVGDGSISAFPALYLASDLETAYREFYQIDPKPGIEGLAPEDFAPRRPGCFLVTQIQGRLEHVFDVNNLSALQPYVKILASFSHPRGMQQIARSLRLPPGLIRGASGLRRSVLSKNWRSLPSQFDVPANCQILGRFLCDAGFEGIRYPSSKSGNPCLAVFPRNLRHSGSFVELSGGYPYQVQTPRLDAESADRCV